MTLPEGRSPPSTAPYPSGRLSIKAWQTVSGCCLLFIFLLDALTPLGFAHGVLYCLLLLLLLPAHNNQLIALTTAASMVLTAVGYFTSPPAPEGITLPMVLGNRTFTLLAIGITGLLCLQIIRQISTLRDTNEQLQATQSRLSDQHRLLNMAGRTARFGGWRLDLETQRITWSDEAAQMHGLPAGTTPDLDEVISYYASEQRPRLEQYLYDCSHKGTPFDDHFELTSLRGDQRWIRVLGQPLRDEKQQVRFIEGAMLDMTDQKQTQLRLKSSEESFQQLTDAMPIITWTAQPDGHVDGFNRRLSQFTGVPEETLLKPGAWLMVIHPQDRDRTVEAWQRTIQKGAVYSIEFRILRADGHYVWHLTRAQPVFDREGEVSRYYGTAIDIQALKDLQCKAQTLADRLTSTIESITDAFFTLDQSFRFTFVNRNAQSLLGLDQPTLLGQVIWEVTDIPEQSELIRQLRLAQQQHEAISLETHLPDKECWLQVRAYPAPDGLTVYLQDVTQQRQDQEQLKQAQRLESIGHLTGGIAHDFNNLLTVIIGNAELLAEELQQDDERQALVELIETAARRGAELTSRLLAFARRQPLVAKVIDINQTVRSMTALLQHALGEHIEISLITGSDLWPALVDPGQLEGALLNLAINARDAMPRGGKLTIETHNVELDADYAAHHEEIEPGEYVMLALTDTGTGMSQETLQHVFEPFFTTKEKGKGTGLGLSMVYGFVKQSKGHVSIYSELGEGTTIRIYLPRSSKPQPDEHHPARPITTAAGTHTLLLVEDDELVRRFALRQLEQAGYRVISAENGPQALTIFKSRQDIDLLFTDVVMPGGMSGRDLAQQCLALNPALKVLYTSGYTQNSIVHNGRLDPGVQLLEKPYKRHELLQSIHEVLSNHHD